MQPNILKKFLQLESASAIILFMMTILAMLWANSSIAYLHQQFINTFLFTINDGLMAIFFLIVGLELKRGYVSGQLSKVSQILLPALAALGGMLVPAGIYIAFNYNHPVSLQGWSTPVATDIAFALGVLSLFGKRIPASLKLFLLALAIFDDIGAIIIITLFYSHGLSCLYLFLSAFMLLLLYMLNRFSVHTLIFYLLAGVALWVCLLYAGIHPTLAGVLLAFAIPVTSKLESRLHPYVAYIIVPLFALANAGFSLQGLSWQVLTSDVVVGIIAGLFIGKQVGVFGFSWVMVKLDWVKLPKNTTWLALYGIALLCGIGFTMSLFLGTLSFQNENLIYLTEVRLGVIIGSLLSGLTGALVLWRNYR